MKHALLLCLALGGIVYAVAPLDSQDAGGQSLADQVNARLEAQLQGLHDIYFGLHKNPELSTKEVRSSRKLADALKQYGYEVTEKIGSEAGGFGIVGILKNGDGPTVMIRTDMDALPIIEQTGLAYASQVRVRDTEGKEVVIVKLHTQCRHGLQRYCIF